MGIVERNHLSSFGQHVQVCPSWPNAALVSVHEIAIALNPRQLPSSIRVDLIGAKFRPKGTTFPVQKKRLAKRSTLERELYRPSVPQLMFRMCKRNASGQ